MDALSNQCLFTFPDSQVYEHQGLNFRSQTEIKIFEELLKRRVLVFPLPVAVMGGPGIYQEPDFLVFRGGKAGILEIHGDWFHTPQTAAKEHERRRKFVDLGVNVFEIYDAKECYSEPNKVVNDFLGRLSRV